MDAELLESETTLNFHRWLFYYVIKFNLVMNIDKFLNWRLTNSYWPPWNIA